MLLISLIPVLAVDVVIQDGHNTEVTALQVDADGQYLVSGSNDAVVKVWSLAAKMLLCTFTGQEEAITTVAINNDGNNRIYVASGSKDKTIKIREFPAGKAGKSINCPAVPLRVLFDAAGKQLIASHQDNKIRIWDFGSGALIKTITVESGKSKLYQSVPGLVIDPGNSFIACTGNTGEEAADEAPVIHILELQTGKQLAVLKGHTGRINTLAISRTGEFLFSAGEDKTVMVWNCSQWQPVKILTGFRSSIIALAADSTGENSAAADNSGALNKAAIAAGIISAPLKTGSSRINTLVYSPDDQFIITGESDNTIKFRDRITGVPVKILERSVDKCRSLVVLPGAKRIAAGMDTGEIKIWNLSTGYLDKVFPAHTGAVKALLPDSRNNFLFSAGSDAVIKTWDADKWTLIRTFAGHTKDVNGISIDRNGKYLASGSDDETIRIWDLETGKPVKTINNFMWVFGPVEQPPFIAEKKEAGLPEIPGSGQEKAKRLPAAARGRYWINAVCYDPGSDDLITAGYDGVKIWNVETSRVKNTLFSGFSPVNTVAFDPARKYTVSGDIKGQIVIWKFSVPTVVKKIPDAHAGAVNKLAVSADGRHIFSAGDDNLVKIWRITDGELVSSLPGHLSAVSELTLLDETGNSLFSAGSDGSLVYRNRKEQRLLTWINRGTDWLIFSPEGYFNSTSLGIGLAGIANLPYVYSLEHAALKNNRPDKILEQLFITNQPYIDYYAALYRERLVLAAVDEAKLLATETAPVPAPVIRETAVRGKFLDITLEMTDLSLPYYNICLNNIPLYPLPGKETGEKLKAQATASPGSAADGELPAALLDAEPWAKAAVIKEQIELVHGANTVEVFCTAETGIQSLKTSYAVTYDAPVVSTLYFLGFGVSVYRDKALNVRFSHQDVKDTAEYLAALAVPGTRTLVKTFLDAEVDANALQKAKEFIKTAKQEVLKTECAAAADKQAKDEATGTARAEAAAVSKKAEKSKQTAAYNDTYRKVYDKTYKSVYNTTYQNLYNAAIKTPSADDAIILYLNGRVYRDDSAVPGSWFYSFTTNLANIKETAISLKSFTALLDVPGVQHKLLITDFADSAEIKAGTAEAAAALPADIKPRESPAAGDAEAAGRNTARTYLEDADLFFYTNPLFNRGIITLASCNWGELSLESSKMRNGLFTEHLLNALSGKAADQDGDGQLTLQELYTALYNPVVADSGGLQHPVLKGAGEDILFRLPAGKK